MRACRARVGVQGGQVYRQKRAQGGDRPRPTGRWPGQAQVRVFPGAATLFRPPWRPQGHEATSCVTASLVPATLAGAAALRVDGTGQPLGVPGRLHGHQDNFPAHGGPQGQEGALRLRGSPALDLATVELGLRPHPTHVPPNKLSRGSRGICGEGRATAGWAGGRARVRDGRHTAPRPARPAPGSVPHLAPRHSSARADGSNTS